MHSHTPLRLTESTASQSLSATLVQPAEAARDAGVVDADVDAALALGDRVERGVDRGGDGHVQLARLDAVELPRQSREAPRGRGRAR